MRSKNLYTFVLALVISTRVFSALPQLQDDETIVDGSGGAAVAPRAPMAVVDSDPGAPAFVAENTEPCKKPDNGLSLATIKSITRGGKSISVTPAEKVIDRNGKKITVKDYDQLQVYVPSHVQQCMNLGVSARKLGNDVILEFRNYHEFKPKEAYDGMSGDAKLEKCLAEDVWQGDVKVTTKVIDNKKFIPNLLSSPVSRTVEVSKAAGESFDISKDVNIYVASAPTGNTHVAAYDKDLVSPAGASRCYVYERPSAKGMKLVDRSKLMAYRDLQDCDGQCGAAISAAMDELRMQNIGNGNELFDVLSQARGRLMDAEIKRVEKRLEEVTKELAKATDEQSIREKLREYVSLMSDYESFPQKPRLEELKILHMKLEKNEGNKDEIQRRIKELKSLIGEISKSKYGTEIAIKKTEEMGLKDDGDYLAKMRLTASYYSDKQFLGTKSEAMTADQAQKKVDQELVKYQVRSKEMLELYESKNGIANHSRKYEREVQSAMNKRDTHWQNFMKVEQDYSEACQSAGWFSQGMKNPQKCKRGQMSRQQRYGRAMQMRQRDEKRISRKYQVASTLAQNEEEYRRKVASEHEDSSGDILDNSSVLDYSDEFTGDASGTMMFQMNGMNNQQFYNPMMQQQPMYQQQQQQMQYNMPMR